MKQLEQQSLEETVIQSSPDFIEGNTIPVTVEEIKTGHIIPVFTRNNEPLINHTDFIEGIQESVKQVFPNEIVLAPMVKVSHPIKGRIPEAKNKLAIALQEHEKTLYYERMMFTIEIPSIRQSINGSELSLTVGGIKAFNLDNVYSRRAEQSFKVFIGFKNFVCTNLCISNDGVKSDLFASTINEVISGAIRLFKSYQVEKHLSLLQEMNGFQINESQLAQLLGKARLYQYLPKELKKQVTELKLNDSQLSQVANGYYNDPNFCKDIAGNISLWKVYNLFSGANKSSYIDSFIDRGVNSHSFIQELTEAIKTKDSNWFLN